MDVATMDRGEKRSRREGCGGRERERAFSAKSGKEETPLVAWRFAHVEKSGR